MGHKDLPDQEDSKDEAVAERGAARTTEGRYMSEAAQPGLETPGLECCDVIMNQSYVTSNIMRGVDVVAAAWDRTLGAECICDGNGDNSHGNISDAAQVTRTNMFMSSSAEHPRDPEQMLPG